MSAFYLLGKHLHLISRAQICDNNKYRIFRKKIYYTVIYYTIIFFVYPIVKCLRFILNANLKRKFDTDCRLLRHRSNYRTCSD